MISRVILKRMIELGCREDIDRPEITEIFADLRNEGEINYRWTTEWQVAARRLSTPDIVSLLKGLTIAEQRFRWTGGSVAAAIQVYRILETRDPALAIEAGEWVIRRSSNKYVPYGRSRWLSVIPFEMQATLDELNPDGREEWYQRFLRSRRESHAQFLEEKRIRKERNERQQQDARENKRQKRLERPLASIKNVDDWKRTIQDAGKEDPQARLRAIACHPEIPLNFFPKEWGNVDDGILKTMEEETKKLLLERMKGRRGEPWRTLFRSIGGK